MYEELEPNTQEVVFSIIWYSVKFNFVSVQKQKGGRDCGLFAITIATAISNGMDPSKIEFDQAAMHSHLVASNDSISKLLTRSLIVTVTLASYTSSFESISYDFWRGKKVVVHTDHPLGSQRFCNTQFEINNLVKTTSF